MFVFAYGMNLDPSNMHMGCEEVASARLRDWELSFRGGLADVQPAPGQYVEGALWEVSKRALARLDARENTPHMYARVIAPVGAENMYEDVASFVYTMTPEFIRRPSHYGDAPSSYYLSMILHGYTHFDLDTDALWKAVRKSCANAQEFRVLYLYTLKEVEQYA